MNARIGEGVIYDLRVALFARLQRMSLRFFTNTRVGELMSRLNNDVVGAQNAISNTIVGILTNIIQASRRAAGDAQPGVAADPDQRVDPAACSSWPPGAWATACVISPARQWTPTPR